MSGEFKLAGMVNPFTMDRVTDPFGEQAVDITDFNQKAFATIVQEIRFVRESRHCRGVLVLGEAGSGKTHLLSRIHSQLASENHLLFVPRPTNPESVFATIWGDVFASLNRLKPGANGQTQADVLLREGFARLIERSYADDTTLAPATKDVWIRFARRLRAGEPVGDKVDAARNRIREAFRDFHSPRNSTEDFFVQALFSYLVYQDKARRRAVYEYLTRYEVDEQICSLLGMQPWVNITEDSSNTDVVKRREDWALSGCRVVSELASYGAPLVLAFDQVEGMRDRLELTRAWGDALRELMDQGRNTLVICCVFPSLWKEWFTKPNASGFAPLDDSVIQRLAARRLELDGLSLSVALDLAKHRLASLGIKNERQPLYPFPEGFIDKEVWPETKHRGVRAFLQKCAEHFAELLYEERAKPALIDAPQAIESSWRGFRLLEQHTHDHDTVSKLREILEKFEGITVVRMEGLGTKVLPDLIHAVIQTLEWPNRSLCIGVCNLGGQAFAARTRNWMNLCARFPDKLFVLLRSGTRPLLGETTATTQRVRSLGKNFIHLTAPQEQLLQGLHATLVAIEEGDLWAREKPVTSEDFASYLQGGAVAAFKQLFGISVEFPRSEPKQDTIKDKKLNDLIALPQSQPPTLLPPTSGEASFSISDEEAAAALSTLRAFVAEHRVPIVLSELNVQTDVVAAPHLISILAPMQHGRLPNSLEKYEKGLALAAKSDARLYADVARGRIVVEIGRKKRQPWLFGHAYRMLAPASSDAIELPLGLTSLGEFRSFDFFTPGPNLLIGGSAGSGKSNFLTCAAASLVLRYSPSQINLSFCDVKQVDFSLFEDLRTGHIHAFETEASAIARMLESFVELMEHRLQTLRKIGAKKWAQVGDSPDGGPFHIIFVDEVADLFGCETGEQCAALVQRLAQKGRAAGIGIILCSQYPKASIINSSITANFTHRVAFRLPKAIQSKVVVEEGGAEKLQGQGDCIAKVGNHDLERLLVPQFDAETEAWFLAQTKAMPSII